MTAEPKDPFAEGGGEAAGTAPDPFDAPRPLHAPPEAGAPVDPFAPDAASDDPDPGRPPEAPPESPPETPERPNESPPDTPEAPPETPDEVPAPPPETDPTPPPEVPKTVVAFARRSDPQAAAPAPEPPAPEPDAPADGPDPWRPDPTEGAPEADEPSTQALADAPETAPPPPPRPAPAAAPPPDPAAPPPGAEADLADLLARPHAWSLFAAVEAIHAARPDLPGPGASSRIADDPVRLRQRPTLALKPSAIVAARRVTRGERPAVEIEQVAFGPLGPGGPLPTHVTDDALREAKEGRPWLSAFLDLFTHRMLHLLVAAWQAPRLATRRAFTEGDPWPRRIASLIGLGPPELRGRDALPDDLKLFMAGWFASRRRSTAALAGVLEGAVGAPVEVREHAPEWLPIPEAEQSRLGVAGATLGRDLVLGPRFFSLQSRLHVRTAPLDAEGFRALLPGGARLDAARAAARLLMGLSAAWELQLRLRPEAVPDLALDGRGRLGLDGWLATRAPRTEPAEDVTLEGAPPPERARAA